MYRKLVIGNAVLVKDAIYYDSVDDAIIAPEQVADIALDLVDDFTSVSVIGNAVLVKDAIYYDSVDDAIIAPEQVADIACIKTSSPKSC